MVTKGIASFDCNNLPGEDAAAAAADEARADGREGEPIGAIHFLTSPEHAALTLTSRSNNTASLGESDRRATKADAGV